MAKRILAIVLALVLSLSALSVGVFAEWSGAQLIYDESGKTLKLSWVEYSADAAKYTATIYNSSNASVRTQTFTKDANGNVTKELSYSNPAGGKYYAEVVAYNSDGRKLDSCITSDVTVPTVVTNNGITLTQAANGSVTVSWNTVSGAVAYIVDVNYRDASNASKSATHNVGTATTYSVNDADYDKLTSITVSYQDSALNKRTIGTVYPSSSGGGSLLPGYTGGDGVGQVTLNYYTGVISWINQGSQPHYVTAYLIGQSLGKNNCLMQGSCDVSSLLRQYYNQVIYFTVYAGDPDNGGVAIGSATYNPNYTGIYPGTGYYPGSSSGVLGYTGINVVVSGGWATVTWNQVPYATAYNVQYVINNRTYNRQLSGTQTSVQLDCSAGLQVVVSYVYNGGTYTVGSATVSANGEVSYTGTSYNPGNSNYITGNNCTLNVGATTSTVTWYPNSAAMGYNVIYTNNDNGSTQVATLSSTTTATIPLGYNNCNSFDVNVIALSTTGNGIVASVRYSGNIYNAGTNTTNKYTKSYVDGLTLTQVNSTTTRVSWNAVSNASYYVLTYYRIDLATPIDQYIYSDHYDVPLGKSAGFVVEVYAYTTAGRMVRVGEAVHIAGDSFDNKTQSSTTDTTPAYVTNLKGTSGNKKISLSWNAASGNPTYTVYWKKSSESGWKKLGTTTKRAVTVTGLVNGRSYDFKVTANSKDSGILTMAPQASGSVVGTAPDPDSTTSTSTVPVITSASGGSGSITVSWSGVSGAQSYQVWVAASGSNTYNHKATVSGTSATIKGLAAGTYKVRVKASKDGKTWPTLAEASSDYVTVTVK